MSEHFARPASELAVPRVGTLEVAAAPSGGRGLALNEQGYVPQVAMPPTVTGRVTLAGAVAAGTGFTVSKIATGQYRIVFARAFATSPLIFGTVESTTINGFVEVSPSLVATTGFDAFVINAATSATVDQAFQFLATSII